MSELIDGGEVASDDERIASIKGDLETHADEATDGSDEVKALTQSIEEMKSELRDAHSRLAEEKTQRVYADEEVEAVRLALSQKTASYDEIEARFFTVQRQYDQALEEQKSQKEDADAAIRRAHSSSAEQSDLAIKELAGKAEAELQSLQQQSLQQLKDQEEKSQIAFRGIEKQLKESEEQVKEINERLMVLREQLAVKTAQLEASTGQCNTLNQQLTASEARAHEAEVKSAADREHSLHADAQVEQLTAQLKVAAGERDAAIIAKQCAVDSEQKFLKTHRGDQAELGRVILALEAQVGEAKKRTVESERRMKLALEDESSARAIATDAERRLAEAAEERREWESERRDLRRSLRSVCGELTQLQKQESSAAASLAAAENRAKVAEDAARRAGRARELAVAAERRKKQKAKVEG